MASRSENTFDIDQADLLELIHRTHLEDHHRWSRSHSNMHVLELTAILILAISLLALFITAILR